VIYRFIQDTNALLVAILGGAIDATSSVALTFDQAVNKFKNVQSVRDLMLDKKETRQALPQRQPQRQEVPLRPREGAGDPRPARVEGF